MRLDKGTKKDCLWVLLITAFLTGFVIFAFAKSCQATDVCFTEESAKKLVVELEVCQNIKGQIEIMKQQTIEDNNQAALLKDKIGLYERQLIICNENIEKWKKVADEQEKICNEQKPKFMDQALKALGFLGLGIILGLIL